MPDFLGRNKKLQLTFFICVLQISFRDYLTVQKVSFVNNMLVESP